MEVEINYNGTKRDEIPILRKNVSQNPLKIIFFTIAYPSNEEPVNGIYIREHAHAAALVGTIAVVFSRVSSGLPLLRPYHLTDGFEHGIRTVRISVRTFGLPETLLNSIGLLLGFRHLLSVGFRPDIIHANLFASGVPAVFIRWFHGIPFVVSEHWGGIRDRILRWHGILILRFVMQRAKVVLPVSYDLASRIEAYGVRAKFSILPNVVDTDLFRPVDRSSNMRSDSHRLLTVALLRPVKGIPYLLKAINILRKRRGDFILDVVGDGPYLTEYKALTSGLDLEDIVIFHGSLHKKDVAQLMQDCTFLILPSLGENQPVVLLEAMACGKPVVATKVGGVGEIVDRSRGLLVQPKNPQELAKAIDLMLNTYQTYDPGEISTYAERYSQTSVAHELIYIYKWAVQVSDG